MNKPVVTTSHIVAHITFFFFFVKRPVVGLLPSVRVYLLSLPDYLNDGQSETSRDDVVTTDLNCQVMVQLAKMVSSQFESELCCMSLLISAIISCRLSTV